MYKYYIYIYRERERKRERERESYIFISKRVIYRFLPNLRNKCLIFDIYDIQTYIYVNVCI